MIYYLIKDGENYYVKGASGYKPNGAVAIVPTAFEKSDFPFLKGEMVQEDGAQYYNVVIDQVAKGNDIAANQLDQNKKDLRAQYLADIDQEMTNIFGTTNREKASSMFQTWKEWKDDPSFFSDKGLYDEFGSPLDTASKISIYAVQKINQAKDYSVFLMTREKQYKDALAAL